MMEEAYLNINGIPTHILTWGKWVQDSLNDTNELIVCVTGNPGTPGYYIDFLTKLYYDMKCQTPIWLIGHAGHDDPPSSFLRQVPDLADNEKYFDLDGQIAHKIDFIEHFVPSHVNIKLIGHSIGCEMILKLLKQRNNIKSQVKMCYLLFPDIGGRHKESRWGDYLFWRAAVLLLEYFYLLPDFVKLIIVTHIVRFLSISPCFVKSFLKNISPTVIEKVEFLKKKLSDKDVTRCIDCELIQENSNILKFYCGQSDVDTLMVLKGLVPEDSVYMDQQGIEEHFTLYHSFAMADEIRRIIQK